MPLPSTYDPNADFDSILNNWRKIKVGSPEMQEPLQNSPTKAPTYTIIAPPPNLTGDLHAGHAFEHYLMDTLARIARQNDYKTLYYPGVDHAGLQLEGIINKLINQGEFDDLIVEKAPDLLKAQEDEKANLLKTQNPDLWLECAESKVRIWRANQLEQARILGELPDFDRLLFTLDPKAVEMVNYAFIKYYENGLIYKDKYLVNWSVGLQSALSDVPEDIAHIERVDPLITFEYRLDTISDPEHLLDVEARNELHDKLGYLLVATVRPETIFGDVAVAMHPNILKKRLQNQKLEDLITEKKVQLIFNLKALGVENILLLIDDSVDESFGTGCLKITPSHDAFDFEMAVKHKLRNPGAVINKQGKLTELAGKYVNLNVEQARTQIIQSLMEYQYVPRKPEFENIEIDVKEEFPDVLFKQSNYEKQCELLQKFFPEYQVDWNYKHNVTICERSKTVVEPLISEEFFVDYKHEFTHEPIRNWLKDSWTTTLIKTSDLILRPLEIVDAKGIQANMNSKDADLIISPLYSTIEAAEEWIKGRRAELQSKSRLTMSIIDTKSGDFVGYTGVRFEDNQYKLTIWLIDKYKSKGLGNQALAGLINWCWENINATELVWEAKSYNDKSLNLAIRLGFIKDCEKQFANVDSFGKVSNQNYVIFKLQKPKTTLQNLALNGISKVKFYPQEYQSRGQTYFENIKNWCISRDLIWGHKMPVWYNLDLNSERKFYSALEINQNLELSRHFQVSALKPAQPGNWVQEVKILDTWFSSTLWPLSTLDYPAFVNGLAPKTFWQNLNKFTTTEISNDFRDYYPTQMMTSAWEIFYAWILRMIMNGMLFTGVVPFEDYVCHAWILDEKGRKMSKSLGNGMDPINQIQKYSTDTLRLAMLSGMIPGKNMRFGGRIADELCDKHRNFGNKLWNIARFLETRGNRFNLPLSLSKFNLNEIVFPDLDLLSSEKSQTTLNKDNILAPASVWILQEFAGLLAKLTQGVYCYDLAESILEIYEFVWDSLADWYIEYLKVDESQLPFAYKFFREVIITLHPYIPFETQSIWNNLYPEESELSFTQENITWLDPFYPQLYPPFENESANEFYLVKDIIKQVRSLRGLFGLDPALQIDIKTNTPRLLEYSQYLKLLARVNVIESSELAAYQISNINFRISLNILEYIKDKEVEIARTNKIILNLEKQIASLEAQLNNPKFMENAEIEIIDQKKQDLSDRKKELQEQTQKLQLLT